MYFEKLLDEQFFTKKHNCNSFQSSSGLSIRSYVCIFCVIYTLINILSSYFYVSLSLLAVPSVWIFLDLKTIIKHSPVISVVS